MKILIVEDEERVADFLERSLAEAGYDCRVCRDGAAALLNWRLDSPNLVVLDLMLPDLDGLQVLKTARETGERAPVLVLSAKNALPDRVAGLDAGADDYLTKPFPLEELLARVRALLRRAPVERAVFRCADLEIDVVSRRVIRSGRMVFLSGTEFSLLDLLARNATEVVSKSEILRYVWDDGERDANVVEVYINYLRHKLERGGATRLIHTVRGRGYVLQDGLPNG